MNQQELYQLAEQTSVRNLPIHQLVYAEGDQGKYIYFIEKGSVVISQQTHAAQQQQSSKVLLSPKLTDIAEQNLSAPQQLTAKSVNVVAVYEKGSYFGEDGIFSNRECSQRTNSVMTTSETVLIRISGEFFYNKFKALVEGGKLSLARVREVAEEAQYDQRHLNGYIANGSWFIRGGGNHSAEGELDSLSDLLKTKQRKADLFSLLATRKQVEQSGQSLFALSQPGSRPNKRFFTSSEEFASIYSPKNHLANSLQPSLHTLEVFTALINNQKISVSSNRALSRSMKAAVTLSSSGKSKRREAEGWEIHNEPKVLLNMQFPTTGIPATAFAQPPPFKFLRGSSSSSLKRNSHDTFMGKPTTGGFSRSGKKSFSEAIAKPLQMAYRPFGCYQGKINRSLNVAHQLMTPQAVQQPPVEPQSEEKQAIGGAINSRLQLSAILRQSQMWKANVGSPPVFARADGRASTPSQLFVSNKRKYFTMSEHSSTTAAAVKVKSPRERDERGGVMDSFVQYSEVRKIKSRQGTPSLRQEEVESKRQQQHNMSSSHLSREEFQINVHFNASSPPIKAMKKHANTAQNTPTAAAAALHASNSSSSHLSLHYDFIGFRHSTPVKSESVKYGIDSKGLLSNQLKFLATTDNFMMSKQKKSQTSVDSKYQLKKMLSKSISGTALQFEEKQQQQKQYHHVKQLSLTSSDWQKKMSVANTADSTPNAAGSGRAQAAAVQAFQKKQGRSAFATSHSTAAIFSKTKLTSSFIQ